MTTKAPAQAHPWVVNAPRTGLLQLPPLRDLAAYRQIAWSLALRDVQLRYKQTLLGAVWTVLQPLLGAGLFTVIFGELVGVGTGGVPYAVFVLSGLIGWTYFSGGVTSAAMSLLVNEALVTKIYFPRLLAPLSGILPGLLDFAVALPVLAVVMVSSGVGPGPQLATLPLWLALLAFLAFGLGSGLSALMATYRDISHGLSYLLQLGLYASPIVYPSSLATGALSWLYHLNPAVGLIDGLRWALVDTAAPGPKDALSIAVGIVLAGGGILYFSRTERRFADVI